MSVVQKKRIALFASGSGSNAENIIHYFKNHPTIEVVKLYSNNPSAYALTRATNLNVPNDTFTRESYNDPNGLLNDITSLGIDYIVLAGFLWLIPSHFVQAFPDAMINIHPALLPKFGGKGMYGMYVHQAVRAANEKETGITIHLVNAHYDEGKPLFQASCTVDPMDTPEQIADKVHQLEYLHFPQQIEKYILQNINSYGC
jgi:phosphoribosylglycinamide formyltransferase-1